MINQEDLEIQGTRLAELAHAKGLDELSDDDVKTLSLYEDWKDGADWSILVDLARATLPDTARRRLLSFYGYKERA